MVYFVLLFLEIFILFFLASSMSRNLSKFLSINLMSFIFLPGVIIHELSHLFIAAILFVPVRDMEFAPKKEGLGLKLGSVEIGKTDPFRRCLIGFAPVFAGIVLVVGLVYFFSSNILFFQDKNFYISIAATLVLIYLLFTISNTMFSSKTDMEGTAELLIIFFIIFALAYVLGFRLPLSYLDKIFTLHPWGAGFTKEIVGTIQKSTLFLLAPIIIDVMILGIIKLIKR